METKPEKKKKKPSRSKKITDPNVLRSLDAVDEIMRWSRRMEKSLDRVGKSLARAKERHVELIKSVEFLASDASRDPNYVRWLVEPSSLTSMQRAQQKIMSDLKELVTVVNNRWSEAAELASLQEKEKKEAATVTIRETYGDDTPF